MTKNKITEDEVEQVAIELLEEQGYIYLTPEEWEIERGDLSNVLLKDRLKSAIDTLNPSIPEEAKEQALREVSNLPSQNLVENNEAFHRMLTDGIDVEYMGDDGIKGDKVWLIDFKEPTENDLVVCNQFTVIQNSTNKRPDLVLFVNGLPLVVIELKNPTDENATVKKAYTQLQNYKNAITNLFYYNGILLASDGLDAKVGSLTAGWTRFMVWKTRDGAKEDKVTIPQMQTVIQGMLRPDVLLDLIKQFTVLRKPKKKIQRLNLQQLKLPRR